ncbi:hypothetical protein N0V93_008794 [Gnomoniopsis smithogilvyi]|uniref:Major facilitator superfamily (MFS) profile domain-containing protein n=1 Tax=Gnomoniopsis smithogilvyi TaxID=1191159 RepID=A0A9W9CV39_9PEZI|nr:hypothetical protein N0V93_008794 [Gnomoniopsis smithogilvyi]
MQCIRQYRAIGRAVKAQIDRKAETAQRQTRATDEKDGDQQQQQQQQQSSDIVSSSFIDPEKAGGNDDDERRPQSPELSSSSSDNVSLRSSEDGVDDAYTTTATAAHRVATAATQYTARAALGHSLTGIHARARHTHEGRKGMPVFVVDWASPTDPLNPRNWPLTRRVSCTLQISLIAAGVGAASGIDATVLPQAAASLGVSEVAESLATGLYLVGMGLGSLIAGPFSETFGRIRVYCGSMCVFMAMILGAGLAPNFGAQITFRLLAGCAASTPLVCAGGSVADMFDGVEKTWAFPLYAIAAFGGPMLGAVMGAYIGPSSISGGWRWAEWTVLMAAGVIVVLLLLLMPETYSPLLLRWKAEHLRRLTGDERYRSELEVVEATLASRLQTSMTRPFRMASEPIILAMTLYLSVVYIVLFTFLIGWPYIYQDTYGISQGLSNIIFLAMFVGLFFTGLLVPIIYRLTIAQIKQAGQFNPELRLLYAMYGPALAIPVSLFWMGWTANPHISIWSPILAASLFGFGVMGVFICAYMYVIDAYETFSASALTLTALVRYVIAGGMTVAGIPFYTNMGVHYTLTILACISCVLAIVPYALYKWGHLLRTRSKYAVSREI